MEDNETSDQLMDEEISAEKLLEEQIPGEEGLGGVIDEKMLDESLLEEEDFNFDDSTEPIVDYFFSGGETTNKIELEAGDLNLFDRFSKQEKDLIEEISKHKILVVGAGGIGCEILKDMVLTGFKDIEVIDLDTIDVSNLNRQFLFRRNHVRQPKATVARESALEFNSNVNIVAYHDSIFSDKFDVAYFEQFKFVFNALDNRAARNHVNQLCLAANVPLIETGTSGYHGQVEVILKGISQCYECEPKPAQKTYPGCTIRNTPSEPVHCVVWAKHLFNQLFGEEDADNEVSPDSSDPNAQEEVEKDTDNTTPSDSSDRKAQGNAENSTRNNENSKDLEEPEAKRLRVDPGVPTSNSNKNESPDQTSNKLPKDDHAKPADLKRIVYDEEASKTTVPVVLQSPESPDDDSKIVRETSAGDSESSNINDDTNDNFQSDGNVKRTSTREWAREGGFSPESLHKKFFVDDIEYLLSMKALWQQRRPPTPSEIKISELPANVNATYEGLDRTMKVWTWPMCTKVFADSVRTLGERYSKLESGDYLTWDKDDDVALDFVTACANIRAYIFDIPKKSRFDVKAIAGNIIPAIATTNAIVSGTAILHSLNILTDNTDKCTTVHLRKYPNPNGELFLPERNIIPPNPECYVCHSQPEVIVSVDVNSLTVEQFESTVLKVGLNMSSPDVVIPSKSLILISSEEGETEHNNKKFLIDLGVKNGSILHVDDFDSDKKMKMVIKHKERKSLDEPLFFLQNINVVTLERKTDSLENQDPKPGCSRYTDSVVENDDDDDDLIMYCDDEINVELNSLTEPPKTNGKTTDPNQVKSSIKIQTAGKHKLDEDPPSTNPTKKYKSDDSTSNTQL